MTSLFVFELITRIHYYINKNITNIMTLFDGGDVFYGDGGDDVDDDGVPCYYHHCFSRLLHSRELNFPLHRISHEERAFSLVYHACLILNSFFFPCDVPYASP